MLIGDAVISRLRALRIEALMDKADILQYTPPVENDGYGLPKPEGYLLVGQAACLYNKVSGEEVMGETEAPMVAGTIRVALGTEVKPVDRVRLVEIHGEPLEQAIIFEIVGGPWQSHLGLIMDVKQVTE